MRKFISFVAGLAMLAFVAVSAYFACMHCWNNWRMIAVCKAEILSAVNEKLPTLSLAPITDVEIPEASVVFGVPDVLPFRNTVFCNADVIDRKYSGILEGTLDFAAGVITYSVVLNDGSRTDVTWSLFEEKQADPARIEGHQ